MAKSRSVRFTLTDIRLTQCVGKMKPMKTKQPKIVLCELIAPRIRSRVLVARDVLRAGEEALWDDYRSCLDHLELRAPLQGFWVSGDAPSVADLGLFGQLQSLRTPLTEAQSLEIVVRPALTDWLDRVDAATIRGRVVEGAIDTLTAPHGHDMTRECRSRIPTHAQA